MKYTQQFDCKKWQFEKIPAFSCGVMSPLFLDCGTGLNEKPDTETDDNSFMHFFYETSSDNVSDYVSTLKANGFKQLYERESDGNLFYQFESEEGLIYISFFKNDGITRIILDRCPSTPVSEFGYSGYESLRSDTVFAQYSLHYGPMIKGDTCDCGMNYVYRLRDNSLIIIDGGEMEQCTDIAVDDFMAFLRELTGTEKGEKIRISLWLCTHAHNDHCDFFSKILRFYADQITVERTAFNFPFSENIRHSVSCLPVKQRLLEKFPAAAYIKPHAGAKFNVANACVEVFISAEDVQGVDEDEYFHGTNSSSMLFAITAEGVTSFFLADCTEENGAALIRNYRKEHTAGTFIQAAHHGINSVYNVYEYLASEIVLLPQSRDNMKARFDDNLGHLCRLYGEENIYYAADRTDIFTLSDGKYTKSERAHVGSAYDGSEW